MEIVELLRLRGLKDREQILSSLATLNLSQETSVVRQLLQSTIRSLCNSLRYEQLDDLDKRIMSHFVQLFLPDTIDLAEGCLAWEREILDLSVYNILPNSRSSQAQIQSDIILHLNQCLAKFQYQQHNLFEALQAHFSSIQLITERGLGNERLSQIYAECGRIYKAIDPSEARSFFETAVKLNFINETFWKECVDQIQQLGVQSEDVSVCSDQNSPVIQQPRRLESAHKTPPMPVKSDSPSAVQMKRQKMKSQIEKDMTDQQRLLMEIQISSRIASRAERGATIRRRAMRSQNDMQRPNRLDDLTEAQPIQRLQLETPPNLKGSVAPSPQVLQSEAANENFKTDSGPKMPQRKQPNLQIQSTPSPLLQNITQVDPLQSQPKRILEQVKKPPLVSTRLNQAVGDDEQPEEEVDDLIAEIERQEAHERKLLNTQTPDVLRPIKSAVPRQYTDNDVVDPVPDPVMKPMKTATPKLGVSALRSQLDVRPPFASPENRPRSGGSFGASFSSRPGSDAKEGVLQSQLKQSDRFIEEVVKATQFTKKPKQKVVVLTEFQQADSIQQLKEKFQENQQTFDDLCWFAQQNFDRQPLYRGGIGFTVSPDREFGWSFDDCQVVSNQQKYFDPVLVQRMFGDGIDRMFK